MWQPEYYAFNAYSETKVREKLDYMHNNPVKAGLVSKAVDRRVAPAKGSVAGVRRTGGASGVALNGEPEMRRRFPKWRGWLLRDVFLFTGGEGY